MYLGTAMSTNLEETKLFSNELPKYFNESECKFIIELLKRYMDDGLSFGH